MADSKISGLPGVTAFAVTQEFPVNDSGTSRKITGTQLKEFVAQGTLAAGYVQVTANQSGITTQVDLTSLTVTVTVIAGRRLRITGYCASVISTVGTDIAAMFIMEGATQLQQANSSTLGTTSGPALQAVVVITPTAAAHTYKLQAVRATGTGSLTFNAAATYPMWLLVEDIGSWSP